MLTHWGMKGRLWEVTYQLGEEKCTIDYNIKKNNSTYESLSLFIKNKIELPTNNWKINLKIIPFERHHNV